ncbi:hypothetical protein ACWKWU_03680 [Chitinophaga lutea]
MERLIRQTGKALNWICAVIAPAIVLLLLAGVVRGLCFAGPYDMWTEMTGNNPGPGWLLVNLLVKLPLALLWTWIVWRRLRRKLTAPWEKFVYVWGMVWYGVLLLEMIERLSAAA